MSTHVFLIFGRFQPPTIGHELLFKTALERARRDQADVAVFVSQTEDKKNPIPYRDKVEVIRKSVPGLIIGPRTARTPAEALTWAFEKGYQQITLLVGDDRLEGFKKMSGSWQKAEDPKRTATVNVEALPRTGSMSASKVSGTVARQYAQRGDVKNLQKILISGAQSPATVRRFVDLIQSRLGRLKERIMPKQTPLAEQNDGDDVLDPQVVRVVERLLSDSSWLYEDDVPNDSLPDAPPAPPDPPAPDVAPDASERVPEDTDDNRSVIVLYPDRRLKFDTIEKAQYAKTGERDHPRHIKLQRSPQLRGAK